MFRSSTIIRKPALNLAKVIFMKTKLVSSRVAVRKLHQIQTKLN